MKKLGKFMFGTLSLATVAAGAYYLYKNYIMKDSSDDFDEFEDEFEDFDTEEEADGEAREYVPINLASDGVEAPTSPQEEDGKVASEEK